ncbi:MAG: hypothetical protein M8866_09065 [marine benthic group bacterium]|jgi:hypothetical protein|nr:hypothetical protein [Candidatus Benthicola marisminoris]
MDTRLQAYLDGDLSLSELPSELRREAEAWDGLLEDIRRGTPDGAPLGFGDRVQEALRGESRPSRPAWIDWLVQPRWVPVPPAAAIAAGLALIVGIGLLITPGASDTDSSPDARVYVQFVVDAPAAETVHLVGDFNEWQPTVELDDADGDGVWSGRVPLRPGVHEYMFVIDGSDWVTDPNAVGYQDDGFGQRNALVAVSELNGT